MIEIMVVYIYKKLKIGCKLLHKISKANLLPIQFINLY